MKRIFFLLLIPVFLFGSCITISETYTIRKDGSGKMEYKIDMSELYQMIRTFSDTTDVSQLDMGEVFETILPDLNEMEGIQHAKITGEADRYIYGVSFEFNNPEALNRALGLLMEDDPKSETRFVEMKKRKFIRHHATSDEFSREAIMGEELEVDESMMEEILSGMKYQISLNFEGKVKKVDTKAEYIKVDDRTINLEAGFDQMLDDSEFLKTTVTTR